MKSFPLALYPRGLDIEPLVYGDSDNPETKEKLRHAGMSFSPMFMRLIFLIDNFKSDGQPTYVPRQTSGFTASTPRGNKTIRERVREDDILFRTLMPL